MKYMNQYLLYSFLKIMLGLLFILPGQAFTSPKSLGAWGIPVIRIDNDHLSPLQRGMEIGRQSKALFPDIEKRYDTHLATLLTPSSYNQLQQEILPKLLKHLDSDYQEELSGVATVWSLTHINQLGDGMLSLNEYQLLNLLPDLGHFPGGTGFGAFGKTSMDNTPVIGRNLDWISTPELRSLQTITVYQSSDKAVVNIGFAGLISILTGFNHHGLFLAYNKAEPYSPYQHTSYLSQATHSSVFDLRKALETGKSNQQAVHYLARQSYLYSFSILMADKKNIQVLEYPRNGIAKVRLWNSPTQENKPWNKLQQIAMIGCHVLASLPKNCNTAKEGYQWARLRQLAVFNTSNLATPQDIATILLDKKNYLFEIFNAQTLQSIVYKPKTTNLYLYTAKADETNSQLPLHYPYLDLIPEALHNQVNTKNKHLLLWLVTVLLFAIVLWVISKDRKSPQK
jgi:hypothetical protein